MKVEWKEERKEGKENNARKDVDKDEENREGRKVREYTKIKRKCRCRGVRKGKNNKIIYKEREKK